MPNDVYRSGHRLYTACFLEAPADGTSLFLYQKLYMLQKTVSGPPEVADRWPKRHSRRAVLMKRSWKVRHSTSIHLRCGVARGSLVGDWFVQGPATVFPGQGQSKQKAGGIMFETCMLYAFKRFANTATSLRWVDFR